MLAASLVQCTLDAPKSARVTSPGSYAPPWVRESERPDVHDREHGRDPSVK